MRKTRFEQMQDKIILSLGSEKGLPIAKSMEKEYKALCDICKNQPQAMERHMHNNIFPVVAAFRALQNSGMERQNAAELAGNLFLELMDDIAKSIRKALKIPALYRLMPWIWKIMMPKLFGENAGFRYHFYSTGKRQVKFDMLSCPYLQICQDLSCPELAPVFCTTDDICYGNMHPKLIWNRTKTLARGGDLCNFDLYISH